MIEIYWPGLLVTVVVLSIILYLIIEAFRKRPCKYCKNIVRCNDICSNCLDALYHLNRQEEEKYAQEHRKKVLEHVRIIKAKQKND